ncbi:hypothetical protein UA08_05946 [Talaromyces atroroseus]|uniref:Secreted protein n=1 Tax=Talaromyces atroroseus TaxID=1441469 RepID=A0A225ADK9_TALAT|nr:hypothetical protein UA08_05946 [Talaromyces atroroseus]OKL59262.1 hypothetical protein UA08_05946 [Talaromyces atroroseus]
MYRNILVALIANAGLITACTFVISNSQSTVNFGGSNSVSCLFQAFTSDSPDLYNDRADAFAEVDCSGGCGTLTLNGESWEGCINGINDLDLTGTATAVGPSTTATLYPGASSSSHVDDNPLASDRYQWYYLENVSC